MLRDRWRAFERESDGLSLIEVLVSALLGVMLLTIIGSFMISMLKTQSSVATSTSAITAGQQVTTTIDRAVRNSSTTSVTSIASDRLLKATTIDASATGVWGCSYWYYSATDKTLRFMHSATAVAAPTSTAGQRNWTLLAKGVTRIPAAGAVASPQIFAVTTTSTGQTLTVAFRTATSSTANATFRNSTSNVTVPTASVTC